MEPGINKKYNGGEKRCAGSQGRFEEEKGEGGTASSLDSQKQLEREKRARSWADNVELGPTGRQKRPTTAAAIPRQVKRQKASRSGFIAHRKHP